jgi:2-C-methyl-D-erythritol 4-phosphate cytidylyltransferase
MISVLIPAAGHGLRLGGVTKALLPLLGRPMLLFSVDALLRVEDVGEILVAAPADALERFEDLRRATDSWSRTIAGGETRAASVRALVQLARGDRVLVHDAARPCVTTRWVTELLRELGSDAAGVPALEVSDTLKRVESGVVTETVPRDALFAVQTPQIFETELLRRAHDAPRVPSSPATDDASLVEALGARVRILAGEPRNLKVTRPEDVHLVETLLLSLQSASDGGSR